MITAYLSDQQITLKGFQRNPLSDREKGGSGGENTLEMED